MRIHENKSKVVTEVNYEETVKYILSVPKFTKKNKPENTVELMERLGRPERGMKIIHVAGTNGKGSVCAFLSEVLDKAGKRVGLFTSPHLVRINERFQFNNKPISDQEFLSAYEKVEKAVKGMTEEGFSHPTYFELLFALAMVAFRDAKMEYVILETGLGGRLDATNVVEHPIAVVITSISLDHTEILGDTIAEIAWEKAGIIKPGVPVIYDGRNQEAEAVIREQAEKRNAPAYPLYEGMYRILEASEQSMSIEIHVGSYRHARVRVPYLADYQAVNSALALLTLDVLDREKKIPVPLRIQGIEETRWQGRMETVMPRVVLDGAHNEAGVEEFIRTARRIEQDRPVILLFSAVMEKHYETMIQSICREIHPKEVVVTQVGGERMVPAGRLAEVFSSFLEVPVTPVSDVREAFFLALEKRKESDGMLFCVGSLYLIGELKYILEERV